MKKISIIAAIAVASVLTACGDDDSSSTTAPSSDDVGCKVTSTDNSVTATTSYAGYSSSTIFTITADGYKMSYSGYGSEGLPETDVPTKVTKDQLLEIANEYCETMNKK